MNRKLLAGVAVVAIVAAGALWFAFSGHASENSMNPGGTEMMAMAPVDSMSTKTAKALPLSGKCLANNAAVKTTVEQLSGLSENQGLWGTEIYDVPAGTNVQVNIATYTAGDMITGSLVYAGNYGSYNFMLMHETDSNHALGWYFTEFNRCN